MTRHGACTAIFAIVSLLALSCCQSDHSAAVLNTYPRGFKVNCADWTKTDRGTWVANANGTLFYPKDQGLLGNVELVPGQHRGNVDLYRFVDLSCGPQPPPNFVTS
jgi:hypothetical protein